MAFMLPYDRLAAVRYAHRWAYRRNPKFYDYEDIGGDCTNFASQCLYAGTGIMNFTPTFGWYYINGNEKAPAWTGVEYFYNFMTRDEISPGPFGAEVPRNRLNLLRPGDFVQLSFANGVYSHTPIIVALQRPLSPRNILVAAHSQDTDFRPLSTYQYQDIRYIHISGAWSSDDIV